MAKKKKTEKVIVKEEKSVEEVAVEANISHVEAVSDESGINANEQEESAVELKTDDILESVEDDCDKTSEVEIVDTVSAHNEEKQNKTHKNKKQPKPIKLDFNFFWNGCSYD